MTRDQAREQLTKIKRASGNPGYTEPLSDLEIEGWLDLLEALKLIDGEAA